MLEELNVYGYSRVERPILAALVLGEPILLVGTHGTAKTVLAEKLARTFGLTFHAYDASKVNFEDLAGFPNPADLARGELRYVPTEISIWKKEVVFWDELSRASFVVQSKILETIRSRRFMGAPLSSLKLVFAAMNPPTYPGAQPLDPALAGRFTAVVTVPELKDMKPDDRLKVISNVTGDDAQGLGERTLGARSTIPEFVERARRRFVELDDPTRQALVSYVDAFERTLASREAPLDGRRCGMLLRLLGASLAAVSEEKGETLSIASASAVLLEAAANGLPFAATGKPLDAALLRAAHDVGLAAAHGDRRIRTLRISDDPLEAARSLGSSEEIPVEEQRAALTKLLARPDDGTDPEKRAVARAAVALLAEKVTKREVSLGADDTYRVLERFRTAMAWHESDEGTSLATVRRVASDDVERAIASPRALNCLRIALEGAAGHPHMVPGHPAQPYHPPGRFGPRGQDLSQVTKIATKLEQRLAQGGKK